MHPPLQRPHPDCLHVIEALTDCHEDNPFGKFFGACNRQKSALDACFRAEKEAKRQTNLSNARKWRNKYDEEIAARKAYEAEKKAKATQEN